MSTLTLPTKSKRRPFLTLALAMVFLPSCDSDRSSGLDTDIGRDPSARAAVLNTLEAGDVITFFPVSGIDIAEIRGGTDITLVQGGVIDGALRFTYSRTGNYNFRHSGDFIQAESFYFNALNTILGDPGADGDAFRMNLLQPNTDRPNFNRGQLQAVADSLRALGAFVYLHPTDNVLFVPTYVQYDYVSTSLNSDLLLGQMFGNYTTLVRGAEVFFRRPLPEELLTVRGITPSHWVPVMPRSGSGASVSIPDFETGRYELELTGDATNIRG